MARLVRVFKGDWTKSQQGVWRFHQDPTAMPHDILLRENDSVESLRHVVRGVFNLRMETPLRITFQLPDWMLEPDGETCPPVNIDNTSDVQMLMSVHAWNNDPRLCVMIGPENVAKYEFICRTPFSIGARTFLADGITEEEHLGSINDLVRGQEIVCSEEVMNEIFDEDKMVVLYRFSFEIEKAKKSLDLNVGAGDGSGDHVVPLVNNPNRTTPFVGNSSTNGGRIWLGGGNDSGGPQHAPLMNRNGSGMYGAWGGGFVQNLQNTYYPTPWMGDEMRTRYWENLMDSRYAIELQRIYGVPGSEHGGYQNTNLNIGSPNTTIPHPLIFLSDDSSRASSGQVNTNGLLGREGSICNVGSRNSRSDAILVRGESSAVGEAAGAAGGVSANQRNTGVDGGSNVETPAGNNEVQAEVSDIKVEENGGGTTDIED